MKKSKKILVANWKMNPDTREEARNIAENIKKSLKTKKNLELIVCPPFIFISELAKVLGSFKNIYLGAQDVFIGDEKSTAGEIGIQMLANSKVKYAIVGHSSRRKMGETDETIAEKVSKIIKSDIKAVLCVGEDERNESGQYYQFVKEQLEKSLSKIKKPQLKKLIIAYEPVWAIGKKDTEAMKPEDLHEMVIYIKKVLSDRFGQENAVVVPILYGGSVSKRNVENLALKGEVSGLLVGRESLNAKNFAEIVDVLENI